MNAFDYLLKANLYGLFFAGCYYLLLRRHTFLTINRLYLLLAVVLTLTLPLVSLTPAETEHLPAAVPVGVLTLPVASVVPVAPTPEQATGPDWTQLAAIAYSLIALGLLARVGWRVWQLRRLIRQSVRRPQDRYTLVLPTAASVATFSFFRYIILNPADVGNAIVLRHEQVHVRQWHSADVLGTAIVRAVAWGCPALWLLDRALRQVHEFLADRDTVQQVARPVEYTQFLVDYAFGVRPEPLTNGFFNPTLLKQRIQMLHRQATTRWALGKYVLLLPLSLALLAMTSVPRDLKLLVDQATDKTITVKGQVTSAADGRALPGVSVMDGSRLATTDKNGLYTLSGIDRNTKLTFSSLGYRTDQLRIAALTGKASNNVLSLSPRLHPTLENEWPAMGATAAYKAIKPNPAMPLNAVPTSVVKDGRTYSSVAEPATFPTGIPGMMNYVAHALRYPAKAKAAGIEGDVYVLFTVSPSGKVTDASVNKTIASPGSGCREEAVRIVSQMSNWIPARQQGRPIAVRYQIPVRFALERTASAPTSRSAAPVDTVPKTGKLWRPGRDYPDHSTNKDRYSLPLPDSLRLLTPPSATVRISTLSKEDPLFVVDGIPLEKDKMRSAVNPNNIESITVLKDGAATTTYGEKGKNGVIFIKTKKP